MSRVGLLSLDGAGPFLAGAAAFCVLALLGVLVVLQSPTRLLWTGTTVQGRVDGGIAYYSYQGRSYSVDAVGASASDPPHHATVYLDPSDPQDARLDNTPARMVDAGFVGTALLGAVVFAVAGLTRRWRTRRRRQQTRTERATHHGR